MELMEAIRRRHAVRQYTDKPLPPEVLAALMEETVACNDESGLHIQLAHDEPEAFQGFMAHYGKFRGIRSYLAFVGPKGSDEKIGYYGERLVLKATQLGLDSCWVAMSFRKGKCPAAVASGEKLVCVASLGYGETHGVPHKSKPLEAVCKADRELPDWFRTGVEPDAGPALIFMTLPKVFVNMAGGRLWGALFFLFMTFASFSTVIAVFENLLASCIDNFGWTRKKAAVINCAFILVASLPCVLGYNLWYFEAALPNGGVGQVLDIEDFLVSNLLLPIGSLVYLLFCVTKWGWGFDKYLAEANTGSGLKLPEKGPAKTAMKLYFSIVLPILILVILLQGLL